MASHKDIQKSQQALEARIDAMIAALDRNVTNASASLLNSLISNFVDQLNTEKGVILNDTQNRNLVSIIDKLYREFNEKENLRLIAGMAGNISEINALNSEHFKQMYAKPIEPVQKTVEGIVNNRFGIKTDGTLYRDGYMMGLLNDSTIRMSIKDFANKAINTSTGWNDFRNKLGEYIQGNEDKLGIFKRFYRNYAYDVYSQVDRLNGFQYAERLQLNYAIYEGGLIETSRQFCKDRNGKVFSREEIMKWDLLEAKPPNYDPITDLGGYGCRHYLTWISDTMAFALRPDLKAKAEAKAAGTKKDEPPAKPVEDLPKVPAPAQPLPGSGYRPQTTPTGVSNYIKESGMAASVSIKDVKAEDAKAMQVLNNAISELQRLNDKYKMQPLTGFSVEKIRGSAGAFYGRNSKQGYNVITVNSSTINNKVKRSDYSKAKTDYENLLKTKAERPELFEGGASHARQNRKILKAAEERIKYKRWTISNDKQDNTLTITHEIGHKIQDEVFGLDSGRTNLNGKLTLEEVRAFSTELHDLYRQSFSNGDIYKISEYAATNERELWAESFVLYEHYPDELPENIKKFIQKVLKYAK